MCSQSKINQFKLSLSSDTFDVLFITQTWFSQYITDNFLVSNTSYNVYRSDRSNRRGGGVAAFVKNIFPAAVADCSNVNSNYQFLCIDIFLSGILHKFFLVYRPPNLSPEDNTNLINELQKIFDTCKTCQIYLLGDFNLPNICWQNKWSLLKHDACQVDFFTVFSRK